MLGCIRNTETEGREQAPVGKLIETCHRLGQQNRVTARKHHHAGTDLEAGGAGSRKGHANDGIERRSVDSLRQPQRVEAQRLEVVHQCAEPHAVGGGARGAKAIADANLHGFDANGIGLMRPEPPATCVQLIDWARD